MNAITRADEHERRAAERLRALAGQLEALERRVDREEGEQADGQRHHGPQQPGGMRRIHGSHSIPSATGMTPT